MPSELSQNLMREIKDNIFPSMQWEDTAQYHCDLILEQYGTLQDVVIACEWCDYLEL